MIAQTSPSAESEDESTNVLSGTVLGPAIQAGTISGDVQIHWQEAASAPVVPRQLPPATSRFTARKAELAALSRALSERRPGRSAIYTITGMAGIGKTTLALHWAHSVADRFPHGQLYVNLRGFDPSGTPVTPSQALRGFIAALGVRPNNIPFEMAEQISLYRSLLDGRQVLVVLDNALNTDQIRHLLPGSPTCMAIATSRNKLGALVANEGATPLAMKLLEQGEGAELLACYLSSERVAQERGAAATLVELCGMLPLALSIVGARAAIYNWPLESLIDDLRSERDRLYALDLHDSETTNIASVFSWSYRNLAPEPARIFRLLGLAPGPEISLAGVSSLAGTPIPVTRRFLDVLVEANLVSELTRDRYRVHDLLRTFAADQVERDESVQSRQEAMRRLHDFLLLAADAADRVISPNRARIELLPVAGVFSKPKFSTYGEAVGWLETEHTGLVESIDHALRNGFDSHAWQLAWTLAVYFDRRGHAFDRLRTGEAALQATSRLGDREAEALIRTSIGYAHARVGHFAEAEEQLLQALEALRRIGSEVHEGHALIALAIVYEEQDRYGEAKGHLERALRLHERHHDRAGQAHALENLGWCHAHLGEFPAALRTCEAALALFRELNDQDGQADTLDSLGYTYAQLAQHEQALGHYESALALWRDMGNRYDEADVLTRIGDSHAALGAQEAAHEAWQQALFIFDELAQPDAELLRARLAR
ncbi:tetratricopeptide repeat protein [Nonomuraea sp. LP-02]|uniref:ATP-binding protein n=1 Tax=Nonomuraea sp. LP-02 TaxID=3097960 RepID=UPI002E2EA82C|nr:tetratricopeptide repeat protein [Nonomuraea sp. LP-02]MED7930204.1 tetratricopeptide repeat protein [Nonomuraea sp. LP-02]